MGRFATFVTGFLLGGLAIYGAMNYHVVRADDGVQLVPKTTSGLSDIYVDIREFGISDWNEHRGLAAALLKAEKSHLLGESAETQFRESVDQAWSELTGAAP